MYRESLGKRGHGNTFLFDRRYGHMVLDKSRSIKSWFSSSLHISSLNWALAKMSLLNNENGILPKITNHDLGY